MLLGKEYDTSIYISEVWGVECCLAKAYLIAGSPVKVVLQNF